MKTWHRNPLRALVLALPLVAVACERPPMETSQGDYRGLGVERVENPRIAEARREANQVPEPLPPVSRTGIRAADQYENVQVLGHLDSAEFIRLMGAITTWVSPEQGCTYCHAVGESLASDSVYTKVVSRRMIQMTQHMNAEWTEHVRQTGVTCYTCHRGQPVPANVWSTVPEPARDRTLVGGSAGQNAPAMNVGLTSLPGDPFTPYLSGDREIRLQSGQALPNGNERGIKDAEDTYGLMIHMSESLGVNCTHCHNSRAFMPWEQSSPARVNAWHAIRMTRHINNEYISSLAHVFPDNRKGPAGDVLKANCATCHQGLPLPLQGVSMLEDYPSLAAPGP